MKGFNLHHPVSNLQLDFFLLLKTVFITCHAYEIYRALLYVGCMEINVKKFYSNLA